MSDRDSRLMSFEIYSEIMNPAPNMHTEMSCDSQGTGYDSALDMTPTLCNQYYGGDDNELSYDNGINHHNRQSQLVEQNNLLKKQLVNLRIQTEILKSSLQRIKSKKSGYQDVHRTIEILENQLQNLSRELLGKDIIINGLRGKELKHNQLIRVSQFRVNELQEGISKYQQEIVQLHEAILNCSDKESSLMRDKNYELSEKERVISDYIDENRELMEEVMGLKRDKNTMKEQIEKQHTLIMRYQNRGVWMSQRENQQRDSHRESRQCREDVRSQLMSFRRELVEMMRYVAESINQLKMGVITQILEFSRQHSDYVHSLEQSVIKIQKQSAQQREQLKAQILAMKIELVSLRMIPDQRDKNRTDSKDTPIPETISTSRASPAPTSTLFSDFNQPSRILRRQTLNKKQVLSARNENKPHQQFSFQKTQRKSNQESLMKSKRK